jgi:hypothetical protein
MSELSRCPLHRRDRGHTRRINRTRPMLQQRQKAGTADGFDKETAVSRLAFEAYSRLWRREPAYQRSQAVRDKHDFGTSPLSWQTHHGG